MNVKKLPWKLNMMTKNIHKNMMSIMMDMSIRTMNNMRMEKKYRESLTLLNKKESVKIMKY